MCGTKKRRAFRQLGAMLIAILLCVQSFTYGGPPGLRVIGGTHTVAPVSPLMPPSQADRIRFQEQATFGYNPTVDAYIAAYGIETYLDEQLHTSPDVPADYPAFDLQYIIPPPDCNGDNSPYDPPDTLAGKCHRDTYTLYPLQRWFFKEAIYGEAQLRHRVAWALSQIWVTSGVEIQQSRHISEYYKVLYRNAFGNYRQLMKEMTLNPAMGEYLDMAYSKKGFANENYPRELLQLFTTGVNELELDGSEKKHPVTGKPIPVYTQATINNFAKVFTGWSFCHSYAPPPNEQCREMRFAKMNYIDPMLLNPGVSDINFNRHDLDAKSLLSYPNSTTTSIGACTSCTLPQANVYANASLDQALDNVFNHPSVPPFVSKLLIQHLVTSNPSPAYVERVASKFIDNGYFVPVRGDLREVIRAILLDPEARGDAKTDISYGKLREPVLFATGIIRAFRGGSTASDGVVFRDPNFLKMSQRPFYSPSVFNYYSPKNAIKVDGLDLIAPEFGLFTPTSAIGRANFAKTLIFDGIASEGPTSDIPNGTTLNLNGLVIISSGSPNASALVNELDATLLHGTMTAPTKERIRLAAVAAGHHSMRAKTALYLTVTSAEYQVQR